MLKLAIFADSDLLTWAGRQGQKETSSGLYHLPNKPKAALIYFTKVDLDNDLVNPFEFNGYDCTSVNLQIDALDMEFLYDFDKNGGVSAYANMVRVLAPDNGTFAVSSRALMMNGYMVLCIDLTRSGRIGIDDLDVPDIKSPATIQITTKHSGVLPEDVSAHCIFISSARLAVTSDGLKVEYL